jgi:ATPase family associated with various cellular activities (AAA)
MRTIEVVRDVRYREGSDPELCMRMVLEARSPLRVELEAAAAEGRLIYRVQQSANLSVELTPEIFADRVLYWIEHAHACEVLLERAGGESPALIYVERGYAGHLGIEVAAREIEAARELAREFAAKLGREREPADESRICVSFWRDSAPLPDSTDRFLDAVRWNDISPNYSAATSQRLERLMSASGADFTSGRLMLWHGRPGTGKTYALRALAQQWKPWCELHYITDPEALLGRASYLLHLIVHETGADDRWRLVVMEDTGELLSIDARQNVGQALSRLLNTTEGLLGQGLRVLFLITTNEELGRLNPAVTRPGRCVSAVEFAPLTRAEARSWLVRSGNEFNPTAALTLSELYAIKRGEMPSVTSAGVGFLAHGAD